MLPRSVTLCSVVIRFSIASQAVIATSMLAALAFSRHRPLLHLSASLSVMRFVNTGPSSMVPMLFKDPSGVGRFPVWVFAIILACTTSLSQFSSTILLSDFHDDLVIETLGNTSTLSGYKTIIPSWSPQVDYWALFLRHTQRLLNILSPKRSRMAWTILGLCYVHSFRYIHNPHDRSYTLFGKRNSDRFSSYLRSPTCHDTYLSGDRSLG